MYKLPQKCFFFAISFRINVGRIFGIHVSFRHLKKITGVWMSRFWLVILFRCISFTSSSFRLKHFLSSRPLYLGAVKYPYIQKNSLTRYPEPIHVDVKVCFSRLVRLTTDKYSNLRQSNMVRREPLIPQYLYRKKCKIKLKIKWKIKRIKLGIQGNNKHIFQ